MTPGNDPRQERRRSRRRRIAQRQCPDCLTFFSLRVVDHPSGRLVVCGHCGHVEQAVRHVAAAN